MNLTASPPAGPLRDEDRPESPSFTPAARLDATGLSCATLTPTIRSAVLELDFGAVLEIITDDPEAEEGLRSWTRLTGNELVAAEAGPGSARRFGIRRSPRRAARHYHHREGNQLMATIIVNATHGPEDPERATLAFITGNVAATADQDAIVLLTIEGAWLGVRGRADVVGYPGMPALRDVMSQFVAAGGRIWACGACTKPRGITQDDLVEGATIVTAAQVVELLASGAGSLTF